MDKYSISIKPSALKELEEVPKKIAQQIAKKIQSLANHPRTFGCQKLSGQDCYRIRQGDYRIVYGIDDSTNSIDIVKIAHRREVYS